MADTNIGGLDRALTLDDESLFVVEQQGGAFAVSGAQLKAYAIAAAKAQADAAADARAAIENMGVSAFVREPHHAPTVEKTVVVGAGVIGLKFGIPRGYAGGYYVPSVSQPAAGKLQVGFEPVGFVDDLVLPIAPVVVDIPAGNIPVKGVDYFTAQDKAELVQAVLDALGQNGTA